MLSGVARSIRRYFISLGLFVFLGAFGGCHPCSLVQCINPVMTRAEAFVGDGGRIYIDIPDRKGYESATFDSISVSQAKIDSGREVYWQAQRTDEETNNGNDFPLLYGEEFGMRAIKPSMLLENGVYVITGEVVFLGKNERYRRFVDGQFTYKNGAVQNLK